MSNNQVVFPKIYDEYNQNAIDSGNEVLRYIKLQYELFIECIIVLVISSLLWGFLGDLLGVYLGTLVLSTPIYGVWTLLENLKSPYKAEKRWYMSRTIAESLKSKMWNSIWELKVIV
ncbi:hypothetical protein HUT03_04675 [Candidatus Liberibacter africanus]|uniref:Transmembrane protein n=1 Tax=Candidatus Liberibacter africanus PTSAPSY TaxID=1277257 RepID=A0A0G3I7N9_LIBAF|nr:hypothetical protein [Candidatus Liberibacter africanus]AKK20533.1 hypothetical protein G293_04590 [Candidatus Liberibacter africanus PTSAPSY]QTP64240.1 hypothetical protein HUT03_04675 [Candidatus Liberibacter africanus]